MYLRSWPKNWNYRALRRMAAMDEKPPLSRMWPLMGMLAFGLVAGATLGGYTMSQRSHMKRIVRRMRSELAGFGTADLKPIAVTSPRSNHRRKATTKV